MSVAVEIRPIRAGVFSALEQARLAVNELLRANFSKDQITVVCSDPQTESHFREFEHEEPAGYYTPRGIVLGGTGGALVGLGFATVLLAVLGLTFPFWLVAGMAMVLTGAVFGGFVGAMMTRGAEHELSNFYDQEVPPGMILVGVEVHDEHPEKRLREAEQILTNVGVRPVELMEG